MIKFLKWLLIIAASLVLLSFLGFQYMIYQTKKISPQDTVTFVENGYDITIDYSRPSKKGREIFGGLVPYNEVWRTGANEATTFVTKTDLTIDGKLLPAGEYTLWTKPNAQNWEVMFNSGDYSWGVNFDSTPSYDPAFDEIVTKARAQRNFKVLEQFTIEIIGDPAVLMLSWDFTRVDIPLGK